MVWYITVGGVVGTLSRYYLQGWIQSRGFGSFPTGTLMINLIGALAIGFIMRLATGATLIAPDLRAALTIGFCGAFTTMSTFSYETMALFWDGDYVRAGAYMGGTIIGCLAAVALGTALANRIL